MPCWLSCQFCTALLAQYASMQAFKWMFCVADISKHPAMTSLKAYFDKGYRCRSNARYVWSRYACRSGFSPGPDSVASSAKIPTSFRLVISAE